jgi:3-hydroxy acid dehydrogenase / malonic semialdehyde reductase
VSGFGGTVLVTGASSGIGLACAHAFAAAGARLILAARRVERVESLASELTRSFGTETHVVALDVRDAGVVAHVFGDLAGRWGEVDVVVNNAGLARGFEPIHEGSPTDWDEMIDTNLKGLLYVTRAVLPGMVERGWGHVVNIGSTAGHEVYPKGNVYCATKHAVRALTEGMRVDLLGTGVRVSTVDPGMVETEFSLVRFHGDADRAREVYRGVQPLTPEDVAEAVYWCVSRPPHVNIDEIILKPTAQATATLVHRT